MLKIQSDCIFTLDAAPIPKGIIILNNDGLIIDVINSAGLNYNIEDVKYYKGIICPGFVNAHCHLELAHMHNKIERHSGLNNFIIQLQHARKDAGDASEETLYKTDRSMYNNGIAACADIVNNTSTINVKLNSQIYYHNFIELFGSNPLYTEKIFNKGLEIYNAFTKHFNTSKISITPHSFYAVSIDLLNRISSFSEIRNTLLSLHHMESHEEIDYFFNKTGDIPERMKYFDIDIEDFKPSGQKPLSTLAHMLPQKANIQLVHNTYSDVNDINIGKKFWWCLCPNSNLYIENKLPPLPLFLKNNLNLTLGTDSLASNNSLSIIDEIKTLQSQFNIPTHTLLKMASLNGAHFLKLENRFGSISKNKKPGLVLISNINPENYFLTESSESTRII